MTYVVKNIRIGITIFKIPFWDTCISSPLMHGHKTKFSDLAVPVLQYTCTNIHMEILTTFIHLRYVLLYLLGP